MEVGLGTFIRMDVLSPAGYEIGDKMGLPICEICAKTELLCESCEAKLREGRINEIDVELSRLLYKIGKGEIGFERAIDTKDFVIVLTDKKDIGRIIGKNGANIRTLSNKLGKQVRVIGTGDVRDMIYDFVAPARIRGINRVYKQDGSTLQRVRVNRRDRNKLRMNTEDIQKLITSLSNDRIEISFE